MLFSLTGNCLPSIVVCLFISSISKKIKTAELVHPYSGVKGKGVSCRMTG